VRPAQWTYLTLCGGTFAITLDSACGLDGGGLRAIEAGPSFGSDSGSGSGEDRAFDGPDGTLDRDALGPETAAEAALTHDAMVPLDAAKPDSLPEATASDSAASDGAADDGSTDALIEGRGAPDSASCDFSGTWATRVVIDVNWVPQGIMGVILAPGSGQIKQWLLSTRALNGSATTETASVCGIALPDFSGTQIAGGESYGIRFPDAMFDSGNLSTFTISGTLTGSGPGATLSTSPTAVLLGLTLSNPTTAPWPATITTEVDSDQDGKPGVTAWVLQAAGYSNIQVDPFGNRGDRVYLAIRQVTSFSGNALDCDAIAGTVNIPQIADSSGTSKYAIDSHVIGCRLLGDAGDCSAGQVTFVDTTQPVFSTSGATTFASVRVANDATCATARQRLP
jgi:hypothetical protein